MSGNWSYLVYALLPVPLLCLLLLCLPLPDSVSKYVSKYILKLVDAILFTNIFGKFNLYQVCTVISSLLFLLSCFEVVNAGNRLDSSRNEMKEDRLKCLKWRSERNFWISLMCAVLWLVLFRVDKMAKQILFLKGEIRERDKTD
jgi:hypothetical protein